jgi:hypothetical protein
VAVIVPKHPLCARIAHLRAFALPAVYCPALAAVWTIGALAALCEEKYDGSHYQGDSTHNTDNYSRDSTPTDARATVIII